MASLMPSGRQQYFDNNGNPLAGGKVYTYSAGTSTPLATYSDQAGTTPNANPIILDARGEAPIFWGLSPYKVVLKTSADATVWTQDNMYAQADSQSVATELAIRLPEIATYAALRAYSGATTAYYVRGVSNLFDGGAGVFRVDSADTTSADNGGTILVDAAGRRWKREFSGAVNVLWFGADRTGSADSKAAIQAAADYCAKTYGTGFATIDSVLASTTANWLTLYIPAGLYKLASTVRSTAPINIMGDGQTSTKLFAASFAATSNNAVLDISRADGHWLLNQKISGFTVTDASDTFVPIYGKFLHNYHFDDVAAVGGLVGFQLEGSYSGRIGRLSLFGCATAARIQGLYSPSTQEANDIHIERLEIYDASVGLEVGGGLNVHVAGLIQKTVYEAVKVIDQVELLDLTGLYLEDWYNNLAEYNLSAYAISTPTAASGNRVGKLILHKLTAVDNKPVVKLDQVLTATITDNYWHNSTTVVHIAAGAPLVEFEYKRNYLKRGTGNSPQEFYGYIVKNDSTTVFPELLASDFITGNNATNPADVNFGYGFSGQIAAAKCGRLVVDTVVPFALRYAASMGNLKAISGMGPGTGFSTSLWHYIIDAADLSISDVKLTSSASTQDAGIGDTATGCYVGGTYNTAQRLSLRSVTFENTSGVNAVEFGRNLKTSTIMSCYLTTSAVNKGYFASKDCAYIDVRSNDDAAGTGTTNAQTQGNAFINTPAVGATPAGTGNRVL